MVEGKIVHMLTGKHSLQEVSVEELQTIAQQQPYFSVVQLLLAKKMKQEDHPGFQEQLYKTSLYFPNTHWLHYELNRIAPPGEEYSEPTGETPTDKLQEMIEVDEKSPIVNLQYELEVAPANEDAPAPPPGVIHQVEDTVSETREEDRKVEVEETPEAAEVAPAIDEPLQEITNEEPSGTPTDQVEPQVEPTEARGVTEDAIAVEEYRASETTPEETFEAPGGEATAQQEEAIEPVSQEEVPSALTRVLEEQAKQFNQPVDDNAELPIATEPYHTVDYFASQGINVEKTTPPQDKFAKKVRKFTDWLKEMKRGETQPVDLGTSPELENVIKDIAENSNEAKEIVTEAMAEVLLKQGKQSKAIQLYRKLVQMYPAKAAYFNEKIAAIKQ